MITTEARLLRLLHLSSASLPVGAYAFSHGLEYAIDAQWLRSAEDIRAWISLQLQHSLARVDLPILSRLQSAWKAEDWAAVCYWNAFILACRETRELRLTDTAAGEALQRLLPQLGVPGRDADSETSFATGFSQAATHWLLGEELTAVGYTWSWLENQVNAATKLMPLGQTQAQQLISALQEEVPLAIRTAAVLQDDELGAGLPAVSIASMRHETQYTRLFRS